MLPCICRTSVPTFSKYSRVYDGAFDLLRMLTMLLFALYDFKDLTSCQSWYVLCTQGIMVDHIPCWSCNISQFSQEIAVDDTVAEYSTGA